MSDGQLQSLKAQNSEMIMRCGEDVIGIGGTCNPGDSVKNYISYSLSRGNQPVTWGFGSQAITEANDASCENGRFHILVRRPSTPAPATDQPVEFDLTMKLYFQPKDSTEMKLGTQYTERLTVEYGGCDSPAASPQAPPADLSNPPTAAVPQFQCRGVGTNVSEVRVTPLPTAASVPANNCPSSMTVSWSYNSSGTGATNVVLSCPAGTTRYGTCAELTSCRNKSAACSASNPVLLSCDIGCY